MSLTFTLYTDKIDNMVWDETGFWGFKGFSIESYVGTTDISGGGERRARETKVKRAHADGDR
jgi:hypothetical protein